MKRKISFLLALGILLTTAFSCGDTDSSTETTAQSTSADMEETTESVESLLGFPAEDNDGTTFTMLINTTKSFEYVADEITGDVVNDAVYEKQKAVEDYLGISFEFVQEDGNWNTRDTFNNLIISDVMAGTGDFDLVQGITVCTMPISVEGYFLDGKSLPYVQFDKPWWVADMYDRFSVAGKLYGFIGDASLSLYKDMTVIFFNKRIWDEYNAPDPYELVRSGEWTLDKFIEVCSGMERDLNGDGKIEMGTDQLTYLYEIVPSGTFQTSLQLDVVTLDDNGIPQYLGLTEKFVDAFDTMQNFLKQDGIEQASSIDDQSFKSMLAFSEGNVATMCNFLYSTEYLRDMVDDYGIVPMPKYDESQGKYITQLGTSTAMLFVPITTKDAELTSKVMEALAYYTSELVVPKYYEVALKDKYARDNDIAEMLDIIRDGASFDFLFLYGTTLTNAPNNYFRFYTTDTANVASNFAALENSFLASLESLVEKYEGLDN